MSYSAADSGSILRLILALHVNRSLETFARRFHCVPDANPDVGAFPFCLFGKSSGAMIDTFWNVGKGERGSRRGGKRDTG